MTRDQALLKLVSLRALYEHPNTNVHEAASARAMAAKLRAKYDILPEVDKATKLDALRERHKREQAEAQRRAQAAREHKERTKNLRDHEGMTAADREWARRDPLGFAQSRDKRTASQKQKDMQDSFGRYRGEARRTQEQCKEPLTYYDTSGEPRSRNTHRIVCGKCKRILNPGEGGITILGTFCCEMVPGPRKKRPEYQ